MNDARHPQVGQPASLERLLAGGGSRFGSLGRWLLAFAALAVLAGIAYFFLRGKDDADAPRYRTQAVAMGALTVKVSATGKLQPTNQVDVGSELSGIVEKVNVDDNDRVKKGQVLAQLDVSRLEDAVTRSRANLAAAEAQLAQARATAAESRANLARFRRVSELSGGKVPSMSEMAAAQATLERAEAGEASARASVAQARAALKSDETNLSKARIRSPIDGVVLTRKVEPGQTVAASFQAPVLFTLAEDLAKMELQVDVDEADVGQVRPGQKATFGVDAWPGRRYDAVITRVGYGSQVKDGVVSYPAVLQVANDDLSLRPGMTGTAEITTIERDNVLLAPNAALRFSPPAATPPAKASQKGSAISALMPRRPSTPRKAAVSPPAGPGGAQRVWVLREGSPVAIPVKTGATDGRFTEILAGGLEAGMEVVTEAVTARP